jgi:hypothetical protein
MVMDGYGLTAACLHALCFYSLHNKKTWLGGIVGFSLVVPVFKIFLDRLDNS